MPGSLFRSLIPESDLLLLVDQAHPGLQAFEDSSVDIFALEFGHEFTLACFTGQTPFQVSDNSHGVNGG